MEDTLRYGLYPSLLALIALTTSCSWYRDLERSMVEEDEQKAKRSSRMVPREKYDQLLVKYEELSKKYEALQSGGVEQSSLLNELQARPAVGDTETVDVFATARPAANADLSSLSQDIETQLALYRKGVSLKASNTGEATKIFQQLETYGVPAIKARAKLEIGELLLGKQQYDLALQVFEEVISKHAHSGVVLEALRFAVICSDKIGVINKKEQYASMLNDVFEVN